jgi:hypothetical protein
MKSRTGLSYDDLDRLRIIASQRAGKRVRKAYTEPSNDGLTGLQMYDLRGPAERLNPVISILRNSIPRRQSPRGSTGIHWKAITGVNTANVLPGVSEGNRGAVINHTEADYTQYFAGLGYENFNNFEAKYATAGYVDVEALARLDALESLMNGEERVLLGGNQSISFGVAPTPSAVIIATGGALTAQAWIFYVVALTLEGKQLATVSGGVATTFNRTNADGSVDAMKGGSSNKSLGSATVTSAGANSILVTWDSVPGAAGYAVYAGLFSAGTAAVLAAIVDVNEFLMVADPTGTQAASAIIADNSINPLAFDGIITQLAKPGSGATIISLDGASITVNGSGTIDEFDAMFSTMWDATFSGPTRFIVNANTRVALSKAVMAAGIASASIQVTVQIGAGGVKTGIQIESILNPYTGAYIPFVNHPFMPAGMVIAECERLPYSLNGIRRPWIVETRQEYYSIKWPYRSRRDEFGVYVDEGLIGSIPFAHGLIQNIDISG